MFDELEPLMNPNPSCIEALEADVTNELGYCGCGQPEAAYETTRGVLRAIQRHHEHGFENVEQYDAELERLIHWNTSPGVAYVFLYHLDHMDLIEHGGSVPGWLTPKGKRALALLDQLANWEEPAPHGT